MPVTEEAPAKKFTVKHLATKNFSRDQGRYHTLLSGCDCSRLILGALLLSTLPNVLLGPLPLLAHSFDYSASSPPVLVRLQSNRRLE